MASRHPVSALGHTRWATQGGRSIAQASPLAAGPLLGTHNGDLDLTTIPQPGAQVNDEGATDSHRLFQAIAAAHAHSRDLTARLVQILSGLHGRAALAWTDTKRPDRCVWLARGGLSPLAVGVDQHGGVWWASNPARLREMGEAAGLQVTVTLLPEGTLWVATPYRRHVGCILIAEFKPTIRRRDESIAQIAVWRGFTPEDTAHDQTLLRHRTVALAGTLHARRDRLTSIVDSYQQSTDWTAMDPKMHDYRLTVSGLAEDVLTFSAEALVQLDTDTESHWTPVHHWTLPNPGLAGRERSEFLDQVAGQHGWTLLPGRRQPTKAGDLHLAAEPTDWEMVLQQATATAEHYRRVEAAWHTLIADTPLPVVRVGEIAGFGRHRIYQIQNNINGPRGRRRVGKQG